MKTFSSKELANVQNYLMWRGHACPNIIEDEVHYICQERGNHKYTKSEKIEAVLEEISNLKRVPLEELMEDWSIIRWNRLGVNTSQIMEVDGKLLYSEDLPIKLWGKF